MTDAHLIPAQPEALAALTPASMPELFRLAIQRGPEGVEALERLVSLEERINARRSAQDFAESMSRFKSICPPIPRRSENQQFTVTRNGTKQARRYASLEDIEATVRAPLGECGLSFRWGDAVVDSGRMTLPCIVSHVGGHSVTSTVTLPLESRAGASEAQKYGAVMTYAQRYSLVAALGLTSADEDVDGAGGGELEARITPEEVDVLEELIGRRPSGSRDALLAWIKAEWGAASLDDIPASRYEWLRADLEKKVRAQR